MPMRTPTSTDAPSESEPVCVVLAAGRSRRFGSDKTLALVDGATMVGRVLAACDAFRTFVVASPENAHAFASVEHVVNDEPERGMAHSLRLADRAIDPASDVLVLLADMPYVRREAIEAVAIALARGFDVAYPVDGARRGHPVGLSSRARRFLANLPDGDTLRDLRDDARLRAARVEIDDVGCYRDIDRPDATHA